MRLPFRCGWVSQVLLRCGPRRPCGGRSGRPGTALAALWVSVRAACAYGRPRTFPPRSRPWRSRGARRTALAPGTYCTLPSPRRSAPCRCRETVPHPGAGAVRLARGAGVDGVVTLQRPGHRVALVELERVVRLRYDVHADNLEPGPCVSDRRSPGAAEQIQQAGFTHRFRPTLEPVRLRPARLRSPQRQAPA